MESVDRRKLRENYVELVRNLNPEDICDYLYQEGILSEEDFDNILSIATRAQRMRCFLSILPKKGPDAFQRFLEAMNRAGYDHLVMLMQNPPSPEVLDDMEVFDSEHSPLVLADIKLLNLKEKLEQQSQVVKSMQQEMKQVRAS